MRLFSSLTKERGVTSSLDWPVDCTAPHSLIYKLHNWEVKNVMYTVVLSCISQNCTLE